MIRRESRAMNRVALLALAPLLLGACHLVAGPPEGRQDAWYFCDETGCYRCTVEGCEVPGSSCWYEGCPPSMYCDSNDGTCRSNTGCRITSDCGAGLVCKSGTCVPGKSPCAANPDCGAGAYCSNGICKPSDLCKGSDCTFLGPNFVCDPRGTCVPGTPQPVGCQTGSACADGLCIDGSCGSCSGDCGGASTCQFNTHCGAGRVCLDGKCTASCTTAADCGAAQTCQSSVCVPDSTFCLKNSDCGTARICTNNKCYEACTATGTCVSTKNTCSPPIVASASTVRICFADVAARPECTVNKDCTGGELCVNGVCRTVCVDAADCAICPDGPVCGKGGFCMTAIENAPECASNAQCTGGKVCLNAKCTAL